MTIVCTFLIFFSKIASFVIIGLAVSVFIIYLIKPLKLRQHIIIPTICLSCLIACVSFILYNHITIEPALKYDGKQQYVSGKIITTPRKNNGYIFFDLKTDTIGINKADLKIHVKINDKSEQNLKLYDNISLGNASLYIIKNEYNKPDFSYASDGIILNAKYTTANFLWHSKRTPYYYCLRFKEIISEKIDAFMEENTGGLLKGMLFGNSGDIDNITLNAFRSSGIAHLLAVSGLHTSLWCGLLILLLKSAKISQKVTNIICMLFLAAFCITSAFTPSVMRASLMMLVVLVAPFFKRKPDPLNSLGLAVTLLLLSNPYIVTSVSFQLSVTSTLGVLLSSGAEEKIQKKTQKIKHKIPQSFVNYILSSFLISFAAGLFTLPVSSYYFGVFSILSPITNILCVKLAFYGMLSGTVATTVGFIDNIYIKKVAIFIFDITENILRFVINTAKNISNLKYCTLPIHKDWLIVAILTATVIVFSGFIISKYKNQRRTLVFTSVSVILSLCINLSIPVLPTLYSNTLTVLSSGNNLHLILRSGTHYMYISNSQERLPSDISDYLPKASCEKLDYYIATYLSYNSVSDLESIYNITKPEETHITPSIKYIAESRDIKPPLNTITDVTGNYCLNNKINIEIVDTHHIKYVIIKGDKNTVYIHLYGDTDFSKVVGTSPGNIFIYNGALPESAPATADKVIINSDSSIITDKKLLTLKEQNPDTILTAEYGDIQIII